jgi:AraC-like DNA-binding protein
MLPSGQAPSLSGVASLLNTSERTLKRWLQKEGTSFSEMLASSRLAKADQLLADNRLTLTEIADIMGFSDLSTFSQAYKRWTGFAPSRARKGMAVGHDSATK